MMMKEMKTIVYDEELRMEAYRFDGIVQPFPNHFHEYYVFGLVEHGQRRLSCKNREYTIEKGHIIIFNPGDNHACVQSDNSTLYYCGLNITEEVMLNLAEEITGRRELPVFGENVIRDDEISCHLRPLHNMLMNGAGDFSKEEHLLLMMTRLLQQYVAPFEHSVPECREEIERACCFMQQHYKERIYLDQICRCAGLSKSALLRAFTRTKGVTPYLYLENIRISKAKKLLEQGILPVEAALLTGFSDQSHFTNYFNSFIGLTPGTYREIFMNKPETEGHHNEE